MIRVNSAENVIHIHNCQRNFLWSTISFFFLPLHFVEEEVEDCFWKKELDRKGLVNYWRKGLRFLEIRILNFTSRLLFNLLLTWRLKVLYHLVFFACVFSLFCFIKSLIVFYFNYGLFKKKRVSKLAHESIKFSKVSCFFTFKLNEMKKVSLKNMV